MVLGAVAVSPARSLPLAGKVFVVDAGHGVRTRARKPLNVGAVAPDGLQEAQINLEVAERLAALLRANGARVMLTRSFAAPYRIGTVIRRDNRARAALANQLGAAAFVAIHCDSSLDRRKRGYSVFWLRSNSRLLASNVRRALARLGGAESQFRVRDLAVTGEARVPAVLVELGFITNPIEESLLRSPSFQQSEAQALASAILETFSLAS